MHEIICPHCSKAFKIDEAGYADILKQVRDGDFDKQLHERLELAEREKRDAIALAEAKPANALQGAAARKDAENQSSIFAAIFIAFFAYTIRARVQFSGVLIRY
mgnify:CR=1 FL=1